ncbi:hypothetical protein ACLOJK_012957 [Asimina triloba]
METGNTSSSLVSKAPPLQISSDRPWQIVDLQIRQPWPFKISGSSPRQISSASLSQSDVRPILHPPNLTAMNQADDHDSISDDDNDATRFRRRQIDPAADLHHAIDFSKGQPKSDRGVERQQPKLEKSFISSSLRQSPMCKPDPKIHGSNGEISGPWMFAHIPICIGHHLL